ncbi:MAG: hypothetical protein Q9218_006374, partial [Villophora microphyllina]
MPPKRSIQNMNQSLQNMDVMVSGPSMDHTSGDTFSTWRPENYFAALGGALKLREAGNNAFRAKDYRLSSEHYENARYEISYLKSAQTIGEVTFSETFQYDITQYQFIISSNEAASWLKHEDYDGEVSRFQKALNATNTAEEAMKDYPGTWEPSDKAMGKLLYRRALAYEGLKDYDGAYETLVEIHHLGIKDPEICRLSTKISNIRKFGTGFVEDGF